MTRPFEAKLRYVGGLRLGGAGEDRIADPISRRTPIVELPRKKQTRRFPGCMNLRVRQAPTHAARARRLLKMMERTSAVEPRFRPQLAARLSWLQRMGAKTSETRKDTAKAGRAEQFVYLTWRVRSLNRLSKEKTDGQTFHFGYCLSPLRRAERTRHRTVGSAARALSSLRRLRQDFRFTRITHHNAFDRPTQSGQDPLTGRTLFTLNSGSATVPGPAVPSAAAIAARTGSMAPA